MDYRIASKYSTGLVLLTLCIAACKKEQFAWKNKTKNTREAIAEKDSILVLEGVSTQSTYAYNEDAPVKLGVTNRSLAVTYPEKYFKSITGPHGESVTARRVKSCCPFKTANSDEFRYQNVAVLEIYEVTYEGLPAPIRVYINFFDQGKVYAPKGFLVKSVTR